MPPPLESRRLTLRPYRPDDLESFAALNCDAEARRHMGGALTRRHASRLFATFLEGESECEIWAVILRETGTYIGHCFLTSRAGQGAPELGFMIKPEVWRQGYGTEAASAVLEYAFARKEYARVTATVDPDHLASIKTLERIGMRLERVARDEQGEYSVYSVAVSTEYTPDSSDPREGLTVMQIREASTEDEIQAAGALFREYAAWLRVDLCFQGFAEELINLPGCYAPPRGRLMVAWADRDPAGCVALRPLSNTRCEMKRLFVRPAYRGRHLGRRLAERVIFEARAIGYSSMVLDTLPSMHAALRLYEGLGFARCAAYYDTPLSETVFMKLEL